VTAWRTDVETTGASGPSTDARARTHAEQTLEHEIEALPAFQRSGVPIASEVVQGRAADVLTAAARDAHLLVLGSHGHSRTWHTVLGSVTEECVRQVTCPIVVIPDRYEQPAEPARSAHAAPV
jgi:nucleotide-binding universal stress UspA family protein